jgi:hypothetical protein
VIKSRRMRWAGNVVRMGEGRGMYGVLVVKPKRKGPLGRPRRRWEDNVKADLQKVRCGGTDCIKFVHVRESWRALLNVPMSLRVP